MYSKYSSMLYFLYLVVILLSTNTLCTEDGSDEGGTDEYRFSNCLLPKEVDTKPEQQCGRFRWLEDGKIIGGEIAVPGSSPWLASIQDIQYYDPVHFCGAIIINRFFLLTAAHCVTGYPAPYDKITVVVGEYNLAEVDEWEVDLKVKNIIIHPDYDSTNLKYDAALMQVKDPISFNERVHPILLPPPHIHPWSKGIDEAKIYGWGKTEHSENPVPELRTAKIPLISYEECQQAYGGIITPPMMCAGNLTHGGIATCAGDWGGPLVSKLCKANQTDEIKSDAEWNTTEDTIYNCELEHKWPFLLGVASWSIGCGQPGYPNVYVDAVQILHWIKDNSFPRDPNVKLDPLTTSIDTSTSPPIPDSEERDVNYKHSHSSYCIET